ncbi:MAG: CoA-binding protein [Acidimicrobiales bacterium]
MPRVVAVAGVSTSGSGAGNRFIDQLRAYGYDGDIFAVHPSSRRIGEVDAFPSFDAIPKSVDYAYIAVPGPAVPLLLSSARGNVRFAQVMSSGFGEAPGGQALQRQLLQAARDGGVRVLGPNCLGTFSPRGRLTFVDRAPTDEGVVGIVSQSGGLGVDIIRRGKNRGLQFSGLVTVGNSVDVGPNDLLRYYLADQHTRVIGLYLEGIEDGRQLFELLMQARGVKPVALLKGGRTALGRRAATSHTGSMMTDDRIWTALARQAGVALVETLDEFLDVLLALQMLKPLPHRVTNDVVLFGNGGGTSVLASDAFARQGLQLPPLSETATQKIDALDLPPGTSVANPIDAPAGTLAQRDGGVAREIFQILIDTGTTDAIVMHINLPVMKSTVFDNSPVLQNLINAALDIGKYANSSLHFLLVLRSDGDEDIEAAKRAFAREALDLSIPVYDELPAAALALRAMRDYELTRAQPTVSVRAHRGREKLITKV